MTLLDRDVPIKHVITTDPDEAKALETDIRAKILDMLADEAMTNQEIQAELERRGHEKAQTTVRHHVNILADAGFVELARLEDVGGGTRKYYTSNTRIFSYDLPPDADEALADAAEDLREELTAVLETLFEAHGEDIEAVAEQLQPCEYCQSQHYEPFIVQELLGQAMTDLIESDAIADLEPSG